MRGRLTPRDEHRPHTAASQEKCESPRPVTLEVRKAPGQNRREAPPRQHAGAGAAALRTDGVGFEPTRAVTPHTLSRRAP